MREEGGYAKLAWAKMATDTNDHRSCDHVMDAEGVNQIKTLFIILSLSLPQRQRERRGEDAHQRCGPKETGPPLLLNPRGGERPVNPKKHPGRARPPAPDPPHGRGWEGRGETERTRQRTTLYLSEHS